MAQLTLRARHNNLTKKHCKNMGKLINLNNNIENIFAHYLKNILKTDIIERKI